MEYRTENDMGLVVAEAIMSQKTEVVLPEGTQAEDVRKVIRIFMCSHPEVFWFSHQYYFDNSVSKLFLKYDFTRQKKDFFSKEIDNAVESLFQPGRLNHLSEMEKTAYVYKWIASNTTYNEYSSFNQTVYSVLINTLPSIYLVCWGWSRRWYSGNFIQIYQLKIAMCGIL